MYGAADGAHPDAHGAADGAPRGASRGAPHGATYGVIPYDGNMCHIICTFSWEKHGLEHFAIPL